MVLERLQGRVLRQGRGNVFESHARQAAEAHQLDQSHHLRLRGAQAQHALLDPQPARKHAEVEHQRRVRENQAAEIDDHVPLRADRSRQRPPTRALGAPVFLASAVQDRGAFIEVDDRGNIYKPRGLGKQN